MPDYYEDEHSYGGRGEDRVMGIKKITRKSEGDDWKGRRDEGEKRENHFPSDRLQFSLCSALGLRSFRSERSGLIFR